MTKQQPKFSIIIPAYNASLFIGRCLDSLICQDYNNKDYEIIIVDDASTDNTIEICRAYSNNEKYPPIRLVVHQKNKRQGGARNSGLDIAKGEWIVFIDADDFWLYDNVLTIFSSVIEQHDCEVVRSVSALQSVRNFEKKHLAKTFNPIKANGRDYFMNNPFSYEVVSGIYQKKLLTENNIRFVEGMMYEDTAWNTTLMYHAEKIVLIDFPFYGYYVNPNSTTRRHYDIAPFHDNALSCIEVRKALTHFNDNKFVTKGYNRIKGTLLSLIRQSRNYPIRQSTEIIRQLKREHLIETHLYSLSLKEKYLLLSMKYIPTLLFAAIRLLKLMKRCFRIIK